MGRTRLSLKVALVAAAAQLWVAPAAAAPTPEQLLAALPPLAGQRLLNYQGQLFNATQLRLQVENPNRFVDIDRIVFKYNMCFREVAQATVPERMRAVLAALTPAERQEVSDHLALPGADRWFLFEEGSIHRLELPMAAVPALEAAAPGVRRFYQLVRARMRLHDFTDISITALPCHRQMSADLAEAGLRMPSGTPQRR